MVYEHDREVLRADGTLLDTLELKSILIPGTLAKYREMMSGMYWIPCEKQIHAVPRLKIDQWLYRLLIERLEGRVEAVYQLLEQQHGDWEETCHLWMARSFGFKVNAIAFEQLARKVPINIIARHKDNAFSIEALFFGQAGLLGDNSYKELYPNKLQSEYRHLQRLHSLVPMEGSSWKFLRMRPANFPTLRIAQFAALSRKTVHLFSGFIELENVSHLRELFCDLPVNPYWRNHYRFDISSAAHGAQLGKSSIDTLLLNAVAIILFAYGRYIDKEAYIYRSIALLESIKAEKNKVLKHFSALGIQADRASESQALLQMKDVYCNNKRCLDCSLGLHIIKQKA